MNLNIINKKNINNIIAVIINKLVYINDEIKSKINKKNSNISIFIIYL